MGVTSRPFGFYLKAKRQQLGMSQTALADRSKIQRTSISRLEAMASNPQWTMIRTLAEDGMGISVAEFFQTEPIESKQPIILVEGQAPAPRLAELMLKTQGKAVPIVTSEAPLRAKVVTDQDISGYCVLDHSLVENYKDRNIVAWMCETHRDVCAWLVADIDDTKMQNGLIYLVVLDGAAQPRRAWITNKGALILDAVDGDEVQPVAFWGRQRDRVEVLGRVIMTSRSHSHPNA